MTPELTRRNYDLPVYFYRDVYNFPGMTPRVWRQRLTGPAVNLVRSYIADRIGTIAEAAVDFKLNARYIKRICRGYRVRKK